MKKQYLCPFVFIAALFTAFHFLPINENPQPGEEGFVPDTSKMDTRFPDMVEWAKAGVEGGIPGRNKTPVKKELKPGDNIQKAIEEVHLKNGGVILLKAGTYRIDKSLYIESGVILRGESNRETVIESHLHGSHTDSVNEASIVFKNASYAGLENIKLLYKAVDFEPYDLEKADRPWDDRVFMNNPNGDRSLYVSGVIFQDSKNCWMQHCQIISAGTDPVYIWNSHHITCRNNLVDRSYNKGGEGNGYYVIRKYSSYNLIYSDTIKRIRHFAIEGRAKYNVVYKCDIQVDVNFHNGDEGHNLIEDNFIHTPVWHGWHCFSWGVSREHSPPGKGNVLFKNNCIDKGKPYRYNSSRVIYLLPNDFSEKIDSTSALPKGGKLYAVRYKTPISR